MVAHQDTSESLANPAESCVVPPADVKEIAGPSRTAKSSRLSWLAAFWRSFRISWPGRCWLVAVAVLWGEGSYRGFNVLTLLATLMLVTWLVNAATARRTVRPLRMQRLVHDALFASTPAQWDVEIDNTGQTTAFGIRLEDRLGNKTLLQFIPALKSGEKRRLRQEVTLPRRGWHELAPFQAWSGYPFGLVEWRLQLASANRVLVFPRLLPIHRGRLRRFLAQSNPAPNRELRRPCRHPAAQSEFHGLRAFRTGDSPRLIHWRTSARRGELMVREFEDHPTDNLIVVLDAWIPQTAELFEEAVSLTAAVCWEWCRQKGDHFVLAVAGREPLIFAGVTGAALAWKTMACLALLQGCATPDADRLLEACAGMDLPRAPILLVSARPSPLATALQQRLHRQVTAVDLSACVPMDFFERAVVHAS